MDQVLLQRDRPPAHADSPLAVSPVALVVGMVIVLAVGALTVWAFTEIITSAEALHWVFRG